MRCSRQRLREIFDQLCNIDALWRVMWWAVVTLTAVGHGDVTPVTVAGRIISVAIMRAGMVALPAGMLASRFSGELRVRRDTFRTQVDNALADGVLDTDEKEFLNTLSQELCLSDEDARRILERARAARQTSRDP